MVQPERLAMYVGRHMSACRIFCDSLIVMT